MSIKKEIVAAIKAESADVKLNKIASISRWQKDAIGNDVDRLLLSFGYIGGVKGGKSYEVHARDYDGILEEINEYTQDYLKECADEMAKNLRNGVR